MNVEVGTLPAETDDVVDTLEAPAAAAETDAPEPQSMDDTIRDTYRKLTSDPKAEGETEEQTAQRARDEAGRFAKQQKAEAPPAAPTETAPAQPTQPTQASSHEAVPTSWKKGFEQEWGKLSPAMREEIHRREQNFLDGLKEYREPAAFGRAIGSEMLPHVNTMRQVGITPQQLTKEVMGYWSTLVRGSPEQKSQVLLQLAQQYGIDTAALAAPRHRDDSQQPSASNLPDLSPVLQRVATVEQRLEQQRQETQRQLLEQASSEVQRFASNPDRKYFPEVQQKMAELVASGQAATLDEAYDSAIWMVPAVRDKLLAERESKVAADRAAAAAAARKASAVNVPRRGTPPVAPKTGTMEDTIRATLRQLNAE